MGCLLIKEVMFANCILFATFCSMGSPCSKKENVSLQCPECMEFGLLMTDIQYNTIQIYPSHSGHRPIIEKH